LTVKHYWPVWLGAVLLLSLVVVSRTDGGAQDATPAAGEPCPVTEPNGNTPPYRKVPVPGSYGNDALWTNVWMWGEEGVVLPAYDDHVQDDGSIVGLKWAWWRYVPGELTIEGHRLDGDAKPLIGEVPDGYGGTGFQVSGITFPTQGCWEVTGRVGSESLTFVVWVEVFDPFATPFASPEA
jgi:hypothetical protein